MKKCFLKRFALVLLILVQCVSLIGCNVKEDKSFQSMEDFESAVIGVMNGSSFDLLASEYYPTAEKRYLNMPDLILNLQQEKINGILMDMGFYTPIIWEGESLSYIEMDMPATEYAVAFPKAAESEALMAQFNEFIRSETENGGLAELEAKWLSASEPDGSIDFTQLTGENGTLHVATTVESKPFSYLKDGKYYGYDADFLFRFAKEYGYALRIDQIDFGALLPGLTAGRFDLAVSGITVTEERRETVLFSDAYYRSPIVMAVKDESDILAHSSFWNELKEDFNKTFIRENRWKLIVEGIGVTMVISILAILIGSLLGFALYMLSRSDIKILRGLIKGISTVYSRFIAGTPVVVILMILFYVVFGNIRDMSGIVVAILGFSLVFGAFVYEHMQISVDSVDNGQTEAAYALGYNKNNTFFRIVLPQAMKIFLPSYCGQIVELIKATAVVGYIAVNDLTKMGDIIRSNTYEAFFPLIATAVIYFILTWIVASLLKIIKFKFEPKRRTEKTILKGVKR